MLIIILIIRSIIWYLFCKFSEQAELQCKCHRDSSPLISSSSSSEIQRKLAYSPVGSLIPLPNKYYIPRGRLRLRELFKKLAFTPILMVCFCFLLIKIWKKANFLGYTCDILKNRGTYRPLDLYILKRYQN